MLEPPADRGPLPGGRFQQAADGDAPGLAVDFVDRLDDAVHAAGFAPGGVSAGMGDDPGDGERRRAEKFLHHGVDRLAPQAAVGAGEVD